MKQGYGLITDDKNVVTSGSQELNSIFPLRAMLHYWLIQCLQRPYINTAVNDEKLPQLDLQSGLAISSKKVDGKLMK